MISFAKFLSLFLLLLGGSRAEKDKKNVLFIAIDDLRPELGAYGADYVSTPNIDSLASKSMLFERAYCQVAVCSPSRASLLTGRRPDTNHVWRISDDEYWRTTSNATNATTIPQYFKENGYISIGMGKIFHPGVPGGNNDVSPLGGAPLCNIMYWFIFANFTLIFGSLQNLRNSPCVV